LSSSRGKRHVAPFVGPPWLIAAAWLLAAVIAQATVVHWFAVRGVVPSLVLVVVVWYAIRVDVLRAAAYGLAAGLCEDVLAAQTGAAWTISTIATAALTSVISRGFFADSIPLVMVVTLVATLVRSLLFWTVMSFEGYPGGLAGMHLRQALGAAALNVAVVIAAMLVARRFDVREA
jgi:rod shape-determining protein MreD